MSNDALQEQGATALPVREAPSDSGAVAEEDRQEAAAGAGAEAQAVETRIIGTCYAMMGLDQQDTAFVHNWLAIREWNEKHIVADYRAAVPNVDWRIKYAETGWRYNDQQREEAVEQTEGEWLAFFDTDMLFSSDVLGRLLNSMRQITEETGRCDVLTGLYVNREPSRLPLVYRYMEGPDAWTNVLEFPSDRPFRVDGSGGGCLLIRKELLDRVRAQHGCCFKGLGPNYRTEDLAFAFRAFKTGCHWWCDPRIVAGHMIRHWAWPQDFGPNRAQAVADAERIGKLYSAYPPSIWVRVDAAEQLTGRSHEALAAAIANHKLSVRKTPGQIPEVEIESLLRWHKDGGT